MLRLQPSSLTVARAVDRGGAGACTAAARLARGACIGAAAAVQGVGLGVDAVAATDRGLVCRVRRVQMWSQITRAVLGNAGVRAPQQGTKLESEGSRRGIRVE